MPKFPVDAVCVGGMSGSDRFKRSARFNIYLLSKGERHNGSGQRLPEFLYPTHAAFINPLHPNC